MREQARASRARTATLIVDVRLVHAAVATLGALALRFRCLPPRLLLLFQLGSQGVQIDLMRLWTWLNRHQSSRPMRFCSRARAP
ncbi:MAG: hypothetical protein ACK55Z_24725, partial [bacterium]